jgi:hypothetical protein
VKKKVQRKQQTKSAILNENFGIQSTFWKSGAKSTLSTFEKVEQNPPLRKVEPNAIASVLFHFLKKWSNK